MANYLDRSGLEIVWSRIKAKFIAQPAANSVTAEHVATFTVTGSGDNTVIGVQDSGFTIASSVPASAIFTDEHTTKAGHYDATADNYTPTASNTDLDWEDDVITAISKDSKGHITEVFTAKLPANPVDPNTVTSGAALTADKVVLGNGNKTVKASTYGLGGSNFAATPDGTTLATELGVQNYVAGATSALTGAMHFVGETTTELSNGDTTATLAGNGLSKITDFVAGDVVISGTGEFVWNGSQWILLGDEGSYALANNVVNSWQATGDSYITVVPTSATKGAVSATFTHNLVTNGAYSAKGTSTKVPQITTDAAGHVTLISEQDIAFPVTSVAGKTGAVVLDNFKVGTKNGEATAVDVVTYNGNSDKALYFSSAPASETNVEFSVDANGVVTGTVSAAATPGNGALKIQGTSGSATATGFTANTGSDATITFAKSGNAITGITTSAGTVTIASADTLPNPNALNVTAGAYSGTSGALADGYDGSATKTLTFDNTTAAAPASADATGNVQFTVSTDGHIKGEFKLPANAFEDTTYTAGVGLDNSGTEFKAHLKEETANSGASSRSTSTDGGLYAIEVDSNGDLAVRVPWTDTNIVAAGFSAAGEADNGEHSGAVTASIVNMEGSTVINTVSGQIPVATTSTSGVMSAGMKTKLDGIDNNATADGALTAEEILAACV